MRKKGARGQEKTKFQELAAERTCKMRTGR